MKKDRALGEIEVPGSFGERIQGEAEMSDGLRMKVIAHIRNDYKTKFGVPRQSGLVSQVRSVIYFEPEYRIPEAIRGLDGFSHIWLIWEFSKAVREDWSPTVRPPRLGGNTRMGVFATRSPFRPNALGLSCVKIEKIIFNGKDGPEIHVSGADLMDGTPIFDIKPYLPHADCVPEASGGFAAPFAEYGLEVEFPEPLLQRVSSGKREGLIGVLAQDPRPSYQHDPERIYGMRFGDYEIRFTVKENLLTVRDVQNVMIKRDGDDNDKGSIDAGDY